MWRFVAGVISALLLTAGGLAWWGAGRASDPAPSPPSAAAGTPSPYAAAPLADPPEATEQTREEKRFARYDKDRDGAVGREEYLAARRKAYAKLDVDGDGRLSFEEYSVKTIDRFGTADADRSGALTAAEFATTRIVRKPARNCPPPRASDEDG